MIFCDGKPKTKECEDCQCELLDITTFEEALKGEKRYTTGLDD